MLQTKKWLVTFVGIPSLAALLLMGCSENVTTDKDTPTTSIEQEDAHATVASNNDANDAASVDEDAVPVVEELIFLEHAPSITFDEHEPIKEQQLFAKAELPQLGPLYHEKFRMLPIFYSNDGNSVYAEIEFANISDEDIVINNDVMAFSIIYGVEDVANSQIDGGEVVVKPGEKEIIRVKAERGATGMVFNLYGVQHSYIFSKAHLGRIEDVEPLDERGTTDGDLSVRSLLWANGNGKLKYMATEVGLLANKSIGTMQAEDGQLLGVLEVTLANTSDETLTVNKVETGYFDASSDFIFVHEVKDDDFAALGELGLPSSVPPKSIVAGYIPFYLDNINYSYFMGIDTNLGYLNFNSIETFSYWTVK